MAGRWGKGRERGGQGQGEGARAGRGGKGRERGQGYGEGQGVGTGKEKERGHQPALVVIFVSVRFPYSTAPVISPAYMVSGRVQVTFNLGHRQFSDP